ncbi:MAG: M1 family metallopeptidase [Balneolaceae bacterium]|nr:M1 family metallopeptidase [Balneolaceae bacterium]
MPFRIASGLLIIITSLLSNPLNAQFFEVQTEFSRYDSLRGTITPERAWWDVTYYHIDVDVNLQDSTLSGSNLIRYRVDSLTTSILQIELQQPMMITSVKQEGEELMFERDSSFYFIQTHPQKQIGKIEEIEINFEGKPIKAANAPWDGGFVWARDENGMPFVANANQGIGASVWWPNKDHAYDESDSMLISVTIPDELTNVSNGRLREVTENNDGTKTWHWFVSNPINNYGVNVNIGNYVNFKEVIDGEAGALDADYWVLEQNLEKAVEQFADAPRTIEAFEYWFGPYPFYEDSYKLVEAPYLGMEHQSSVTYGNGYQNGYSGRDLSGSGWGLKFDFIIVHETGHEWFANNITYKDVADMWIHESFTHYSEYLFLEYHFGEQAADEYARGVRFSIQNDRPIIGKYDVHYEGSSDMYYKGGNMLHTLRQVFVDDSLWRATLRGLNRDFRHQTVSSAQIENYLSDAYGADLSLFFDQYLRDIRIPVLEYSFRDGNLLYRWRNVISGFTMPIKVYLDEAEQWIAPYTNWQALESFAEELRVHPDFYVSSQNILGN